MEPPDLFIRRASMLIIPLVREKIAKLVNAEVDEVVLIPNTTHGINTILHNLEWKEEDYLVAFSTTYGAISRTVQYVSDISPHPKIHTVPFIFPSSPSAILEHFRKHIKSIPRAPGAKVIVVLDSIVSNPGWLMPWREMVKICKEEGVWSVVDGAHSIGQEKLDMKETDPDFFISNCHKWLMSKRGSSMMYVPKRHQHLIKTSFPTSFDYVSPNDPPIPGSGGKKPPQKFAEQFQWNGTIDYAPYCSILASLAFREWIGGEDAIDKYCHATAMEGGKRLAKILGTSVMDETGEGTAHMTNVYLPFPSIAHLTPAKQAVVKSFIEDALLLKYQTFVAFFIHDGKWCGRLSNQVWIELSDYDRVGKILLALADDVKEEVKRLEHLE